MHEKLRHSTDNRNKRKWIIGPHGNSKNHNRGGRFGAASYTALPIQLIWPIFAVNWLKWQCSLAGSSKTAPRIWIFLSIAMGADYSFEFFSIVHWVLQFIKHNKNFLGSVVLVIFCKLLSFWLISFFCQFLSWKMNMREMSENLKHKIRSIAKTFSPRWRHFKIKMWAAKASGRNWERAVPEVPFTIHHGNFLRKGQFTNQFTVHQKIFF